jgi:hypothetical protein
MTEKQTEGPINEGAIQVKLYRGPVDSLSLYEITDYELGLIEKGVGNAKLLEWTVTVLLASFLITASLSLTTLDLGLMYLLLAVVLAMVSCFSVLTLVLWKKSNVRSKQLCKKIRSRVSAENMRKSDGRTQFPQMPMTINN